MAVALAVAVDATLAGGRVDHSNPVSVVAHRTHRALRHSSRSIVGVIKTSSTLLDAEGVGGDVHGLAGQRVVRVVATDERADASAVVVHADEVICAYAIRPTASHPFSHQLRTLSLRVAIGARTAVVVRTADRPGFVADAVSGYTLIRNAIVRVRARLAGEETVVRDGGVHAATGARREAEGAVLDTGTGTEPELEGHTGGSVGLRGTDFIEAELVAGGTGELGADVGCARQGDREQNQDRLIFHQVLKLFVMDSKRKWPYKPYADQYNIYE